MIDDFRKENFFKISLWQVGEPTDVAFVIDEEGNSIIELAVHC